jgi:hypothetical protein
MCIEFWWRNLKVRNLFEELRVITRPELKRILAKFNEMKRTEFMWLRTGTNGGMFRIR